MGMRSKAFLVILAFTCLCRAPWIGHLEIDWDESTYILMGLDILKGNLPYSNLWEVKPPLAFLPYALFLGLFGKSILAIKLGAIIWISVSSFFVYLSVKKYNSTPSAFIAAISCSTFSSFLFDYQYRADGQAFLTEHAALLPLAASFWLLTLKKDFLSGLASGIYCFMRPALALCALSNCLFSKYRLLGLSTVPLLISALYFYSDLFSIFFHTNYTIPKAVQAGRPLSGSSELLIEQLNALLFQLKNGWWYLVVGLLSVKFRKNHLLIFSLVAFIGTALGVYFSGSAHHHYFLQLVVPSSLLIGFTRFPKLLTALFSITIIQLCFLTYQHINKTEPSPILEAKKLIGGEKDILCFSNHILYFLNNTEPRFKPIHPSVYGKDYILKPLEILGDEYSSTEENILVKLLTPFPRYIIRTKRLWYFSPFQEQYLTNVLESHYQLVSDKNKVQVFELRN